MKKKTIEQFYDSVGFFVLFKLYQTGSGFILNISKKNLLHFSVDYILAWSNFFNLFCLVGFKQKLFVVFKVLTSVSITH